MSDDFYDVLGVSRDADEDEIKAAYRKKASQYHPDVSDEPDAEEKFKKIKKAKEVLTDEQKRQAYDRMGHEQFEQAEKRGGFEGGRGGAGAGAGAGGPFGGAGAQGQGNPFGGGQGQGQSPFGDIFEQFFGGGGGRGDRSRPRKGQDLRTEMTLDLEDVYEGVEQQVSFTRPERCSVCDGAGHPPDADSETCPECRGQGQVTQVQQTPLGRVQQTSTCPRCEGEGTLYDEECGECRGQGIVREEVTLSVEVPAGIQSGQTVRMEGEGAPGANNGPKGDLLIDVSVRDHDSFERDGDDLHYRLPLSFPQVAFGDTVEVPTVAGESVSVDVDPGTQSGETIVVSGEGMPRLRRRGHGDLLVHVQVVTPENLNEEQKEALEAFAEAGGEDIEVRDGFWQKLGDMF